MKLSTAMLKGTKLDGRQITDELFEINAKGKVTGCCALGAAYLGLPKKLQEYSPEKYTLEFGEEPYMNVLSIHFPALDEFSDIRDEELRHTIISANDTRGWTRERIAKWLKSIGL